MEDYVVAQFKQVGGNELGLFAIFDGHLGHEIPDYLRSHLFDNIINEVLCYLCLKIVYAFIVGNCFRYNYDLQLFIYGGSLFMEFTDQKLPVDSFSYSFFASRKAFGWNLRQQFVEHRITDTDILEKATDLGQGGSTAVTAILINISKLVVANVGDSRAVISKGGVVKQLSVDHEPNLERQSIEG
ncbi:hypothetical protein SAY87_031715 [Trapa incisa]|uniref:PPM-type phosphatase domain-containing protein n=1 Tax=Trapa incisa TaxID=236973 RepID=A0AAN7QNI0_9MYRT|nr:hypothetical protein SAY87_031715 [Trapa incisa]